MEFLRSLSGRSFGPDTGGIALGAAGVACMLLFLAPGRRRPLGLAVLLLLGCWLISAAGRLAGETNEGRGPLMGIAAYGVGAVVIFLAMTATFHVVLPMLRVNQTGILQDVISSVAHVIWVFLSLRASGVDLTSLVATSAVLTVVIGFSLQDTLGNVLGGLAIQLDRSIRVGDWVLLDDLSGQVVEIRWRYTAIQTRSWETAIVPNSLLLKNRFRVVGRRAGEPAYWRREVIFHVDFRFSPTEVIEAVAGALAAAEIPLVSPSPPPNCLCFRFRESYAEYSVRYWLTDLGADERTDSNVRERIFTALRRAGIPLSIPAQSVFVTQETPKRRARKEQQQVESRVAVLHRMELFHSLTDDELHQVASRSVPVPFVPGDLITRQGASDLCLYVIVQGRAEVTVRAPSGHSTWLAELGPGDFFGEMALLTGEPRRATVTALTPLECFRLDKEAFQDILQSRPGLAHEISQVLARRRTELEAATENLDAEARAIRVGHAQTQILDRIRSFFSL